MKELKMNKKKRKTTYLNPDVHNRMRELSLSDEQARMYLFLLSNRYCGSIGVYHLPLDTLTCCLLEDMTKVKDIGFMERRKQQTLTHLRVLQEKRLVVYDISMEYVALPDWFHHNNAAYASVNELEGLLGRITDNSPVFDSLIELSLKVAIETRKQLSSHTGNFAKRTIKKG